MTAYAVLTVLAIFLAPSGFLIVLILRSEVRERVTGRRHRSLNRGLPRRERRAVAKAAEEPEYQAEAG